MTKYTFAPSTTSAFQFQPTLDGQIYTAVVKWNVAGQRYYMNIYTLRGQRVLTLPLIGSANGTTLQRLTWEQGVVTAVAVTPHGYAPGTILPLTISGTTPAAYNGRQRVTAQDAVTLTYPLVDDPGEATTPGAISFDVSITEGYFTSTLIWRTAAGQFEVNP